MDNRRQRIPIDDREPWWNLPECDKMSRMVRKHLISNQSGGEPGFHWRGTEVTRLEGFTDAVFAFAVTLLVVSLEVPKTFPELLAAMHGFLAFAVCFALLANVWYQHYRFFRRYALENPWVVFLNCVLLFFVLFYVYPLKFLFTATFDSSEISASEIRTLFTIWSLGYGAVFTVFTLLYLHAWRIRSQLQLTPVEAMRTQLSLLDQFAMVIIALLSTALARTLPDRYVGSAGYIYFLVPLYFTIAHSIAGRRERPLR
ncbi:MAG TPA: TMEM175 family protein [Steroidobacteraceae bacterium]|nr:TMEM175 family protein [Steroidobacteraceae bacterium]